MKTVSPSESTKTSPIDSVNTGAVQNTEQLFKKELTAFHPAHIFRYKLAQKYVTPKTGVLDYGCGCGYGANILSAYCESVHAVDKNATAIEWGKQYFDRKNITWLTQSEPPADLLFDMITAFEILEHVDDSLSLLKSLKDCLLPNGLLIFSVPNQSVVPFNPVQYKFHKRHFTNAQLYELINNSGFRLEAQFTQLKKSHPMILAGWHGYTNIAVLRNQ